MPTFETEWSRLKAKIEEESPRILDSLNPPASEELIRQTEEAMHVQLPDDLKAMYRLHNGQHRPDGYAPPIFEDEFLSLETMLKYWQEWKQSWDDSEGFEWDIERVCPDTGIQKAWWSPDWVFIGRDGACGYRCVDLAPTEEGTPGQIIKLWTDDGHRQHIADSFTALIRRIADGLETGEYLFHEEYAGGIIHKRDIP